MMTKKDFEAIASIISQHETDFMDCHEQAESAATITRTRIAEDLADLFVEDNPRFDRDRFLAACGLQ